MHCPTSSNQVASGNCRATRERLALQARIQRQYPTLVETLRLGALAIEFTRVADPDRILESLEQAAAGSAGRGSWQPYWAQAWDSARVVAERLQGEDLRGRRILDLGCGLGLTGAVAAAQGGRVTLVDAAPPALLFARLNCWPWRSRVRVRRLDWRCQRLPGQRFDWIVGSDILYDREDWAYLERFWREHFAPRGRLLLGEPGRGVGEPFPGWLERAGWRVTGTTPAAAAGQRPIRLWQASLADCGSVVGWGSPTGSRSDRIPDSVVWRIPYGRCIPSAAGKQAVREVPSLAFENLAAAAFNGIGHGSGPLRILPRGHGQKSQVLRCTKDSLAELNRVDDAIRGGQRASALGQLNRLLETKGKRPCYLALKGLVHLELSDTEGYVATAETFLQEHPENSAALAMSAVAAGTKGELERAIELLQRALQRAGQNIHANLYYAIGFLSELAWQGGFVLAARGHGALAAALAPEDDRTPVERQMRHFPDPHHAAAAEGIVPPAVRRGHRSRGKPPAKPRWSRFGEAVGWKTLQRLQPLVEQHPAGPRHLEQPGRAAGLAGPGAKMRRPPGAATRPCPAWTSTTRCGPRRSAQLLSTWSTTTVGRAGRRRPIRWRIPSG